jgi:cytochrome o ubiquinol oxidase subunit 3
MSTFEGTADRPDPNRADPNRVGTGGRTRDRQPTTEHAARGLASKRIIVGYGFWIFLLSDIIMFSAFFATYAVLVGSTAGGPSGRELFDLGNVGIETACLLLSSFTCGLAHIGALRRSGVLFYGAMALTFLLGFTLVGCHGLHVTAGLLWLLTMMAQVFAKGFRPDILRRTLCFSLFWHTLDIIWVALFSMVYLMGVAA